MVNRDEADRFFFEMTIEERSKWFPIQMLPLSMMPNSNDFKLATTGNEQVAPAAIEPVSIKSFILLKAKEPSMNIYWQKLQEMPCDIYAYTPPVNHRFVEEKLDMPKMMTDFRLG